RHDQILPFVDPRRLTGTEHGGAVELIEHRRSGDHETDVELLALVDRTVDGLAVEPHLARLAPRVGERSACALELRQLDRRYAADASDAVRHHLDRLLRRGMAEHGAVLRVEGAAQDAKPVR